jgi:hypothetical protein
MPSRLGSTQQRSWRNGECRTTEDVGRLFEHYRDEARLFAEMVGDLPQRPTPASRPTTTIVLPGRSRPRPPARA